MQRVMLTMLALCGLATTAAADGVYFSESLGGTRIDDDLGAEMSGGMRVRVAAGVRRKNWAIEGWFAGDLPIQPSGLVSRPEPGVACRGTGGSSGCGEPSTGIAEPGELVSFGVDVKYLRPLSQHVELYLRGSMGHGFFGGSDSGNGHRFADGSYSGNGLGIGAGVQLKGKVRALGFLFWPLFFTPWGPKVTAAVFIDDGVDFYRLHREDRGNAMDARLSHLTMGWAVGSDF